MNEPDDSMDNAPSAELVGPELAAAFAAKGYHELTAVQRAVLAPELAGRDLRISSQTGSGKTVAIGLSMRDMLLALPGEESAPEGPLGLVVAPTRELAKQVETELSWLFDPLGAKVLSVVGGSSLRDERRGLAQKPHIVVGTPGRLLDHQRKGALVTSSIRTVVLDEADRMLDMGFREDIESLFAALPEERRTHLVSATFPREVRALAAKVQKDFATVEGTPLGKANADIEHVIHLCHATERLAAVINLLLQNQLEEPDGEDRGSTLIFARTRADVAEVARELSRAGFRVAALSGDLEQAARNRALEAFKSGMLDALVATDVAARGIDAQNVAQVIHGDPPSDADTYTHRSGRTGRAGRKGKSLLLVAPAAFERVQRLLQRARVSASVQPLPTRESLMEAQHERWFQDLTAEHSDAVPSEATWALAKRLVREADLTRVVGRLLHHAITSGGRAAPRELSPVAPPRGRVRAERAPSVPRQTRDSEPSEWVTFQVSWGEAHGADPRRLVAMACRRGGIAGRDIGAIRVGRQSSTIDVAGDVAERFARESQRPDPRDPRIQFRQAGAGAADERPARAYRDEAPAPRPARAYRDEAPAPRAARASRDEAPARAPRAYRDEAPAPRAARASRDEAPRAARAYRDDAERPAKPFARKSAGKTTPAAKGKPSKKPARAGDPPPRRKIVKQ